MKQKQSLGLWMSLILILFYSQKAPVWGEPGGSLRVSGNGRFLVYENGTPFFPVADTAWAMAWMLDRQEVERYFEHRQRQGFNTIALVAFPSYEGVSLSPNRYGDRPFVEVGGNWDPLQPIVTPGSDPGDPEQYDYWDHLEFILDLADSKGMVVILLPAWGGCVAGDWGDGHPTKEILFDEDRGYRYAKWLGARFEEKRGVIWMLGGDRSAVYGDRDYRKVFRAMAEGIADGVNGEGRYDGQADYSTTLMSFHPRKWQPNSSEWFHQDPWLDFNSIQDQPKDQIRAIEQDYHLPPAKPTWLFEGGYENRGKGKGRYTDWQIRFQSYQTVFAGGFGITYGSMDVFHFKQGLARLDEPGAEDMGHLARLMAFLGPRQFLDRIPDSALIDGEAGEVFAGEGVRSSRIQATRGSRGDFAMVYSANGRNIRVRMDRLAPSAMEAYWFDPREGKWQTQEGQSTEKKPFRMRVPSGPSAGVEEFDPPGKPADGNDWVLVLETSRTESEKGDESAANANAGNR